MRSQSTLKHTRSRPHCKLAAAIEKGMYAKAAVMAMTSGKRDRTQKPGEVTSQPPTPVWSL